MESPSTAPRWKMQMRIFLPPARVGSAAKTSCWRKEGPHSGIVPTDTRARPPRLRNARRVSVMIDLLALVALKFRRTKDEGGEFGDIDGAGLVRVLIGDSFLQRRTRGGGHLALQQDLVQLIENEVGFVGIHPVHQSRGRRGDID